MRSTGDRVRGWGLAIWSVLALLYLFVPVFIVVLFSFNDNKGRFNFTWQGFTLDHWKDPFADPDLALALKNSLIIAAISTTIATALGTFMALALVRYGFRGRGATDLFVFLPLATPEVVLGAALLGLFLTVNFATGFVTIVIAHVMFNVSYVVVTVKARLEGMDTHIEEAAMDLGATEWVTFRKVTLPLALPGLFAGTLLTFIPATGDFINAALLGTPRQYMIGNVIQSKFLVTQDYPGAAALSFILMAFILIGIFAYARGLGAKNLSEAAI